MKRYLEDKPISRAEKEKQEEADEGSKWDKTDSECKSTLGSSQLLATNLPNSLKISQELALKSCFSFVADIVLEI